MTDIIPGSDLTPKPSDKGDQNGNRLSDLSGGHRHHSSGRQRHSRKHRHHGEPGSHEQSERSGYRKTENLLARRILPIVGLAFILVAFYLSVSSLEFFGFLRNILNDATTLIGHFFTSSGGGVHRQGTLVVNGPSGPVTGAIIFFIAAIPLVVYFSFRLQDIRLQACAMIIWFLFALYWILRVIMDVNFFLFYGYIIGGFLVHLTFYMANLNSNYAKRGIWTRRIEFALIILNSGFYFISVFFLLWWLGYNFMYLPFTIAYFLFNLAVLVLVNKRDFEFNRTAYLYFTALLLACIPPLVFSVNYIVLFLTSLAVLLIILSKYKGTWSAVIISLVALAFALAYNLVQWILEFFPAIFSEPLPLPGYTFNKAILAGIFMLLSVIYVNNVIKSLHLSLPGKWFHRSRIRKILKAITLLLTYLAFFLICTAILSRFFTSDESRILIWFSFHCLFFLIAIPVLASQRSEFLTGVVLIGIISLILYPSIIHFNILSLRNNYLEGNSSGFNGFLFHYIILILAAILLFVFNHQVKKISGSKKNFIKTYWVYFTFMAFFLILSEFDHLMVIIGSLNNTRIDETIEFTHRIPYSIFYIVASLIILAIGFIRKIRFLRVFSLMMIVVTIVKIMLFDIVQLSDLGRTILLLILGIMFLIISYFYNVIKQMFPGRTTRHGHSVKKEDQEGKEF